ncbi:MAG: DNA-processing protein DprA [Paludibacteraceae bacterium]|nr:DNA-processing protein DprA [Paludibacteraceae bacterium]
MISLDPTLRYKIAFALLDNVRGMGIAHLHELLKCYGTPEALFCESPAKVARLKGIGPALAECLATGEPLRRADREMDFMERTGIRAFFITDDDYPRRLRECPDAPLLFYYRGLAPLDATHVVSVVGTRRATDYGRQMCYSFVEDLARLLPSVMIVSGLAYGIDGHANRAAVQASLPTVAVLGHGLQMIYPPAHRSLAVDILHSGGGVLSEFISGIRPDRYTFLRRNRIIAGLSDAVVVVESGLRGGSMNTAALTLSYDRELFAFPGRTSDVASSGCNLLIRTSRAGLITSADDFLHAMGWMDPDSASSPSSAAPDLSTLPEAERMILSLLLQHSDGLDPNALARLSGHAVSDLLPLLVQLEFDGRIRCLPGNIYKCN